MSISNETIKQEDETKPLWKYVSKMKQKNWHVNLG